MVKSEAFAINLDADSWNNFLSSITKPNTYDESCAWLFWDKPFCADHKVYVFPVHNVGLKGESAQVSFQPERREFQKVKETTKKLKLTKIGNVHTHVLTIADLPISAECYPSETDLKYAQKFNDIIRGIVTVFFPKRGAIGQVVGIVWHNKYGRILKEDIQTIENRSERFFMEVRGE